VVLVAVLIAVDGTGGGGQILDQSTSQPYIDDLHPLADPQNRHGSAYGKLQRLKLQDIQFRIYISGTAVLLSEKGGGNVPAAGQEQSVAVRDLSHV